MITINYGTGPPSYALGVRWVQLPVASVRVGGRQAVQWAHMHNLNHVCTCAVSAVDEATCVCVGRVSLAQCVVPAINNYIFRFITIPRGWGTRTHTAHAPQYFTTVVHHFNIYKITP